jgi:hypothetical protein
MLFFYITVSIHVSLLFIKWFLNIFFRIRGTTGTGELPAVLRWLLPVWTRGDRIETKNESRDKKKSKPRGLLRKGPWNWAPKNCENANLSLEAFNPFTIHSSCPLFFNAFVRPFGSEILLWRKLAAIAISTFKKTWNYSFQSHSIKTIFKSNEIMIPPQTYSSIFFIVRVLKAVCFYFAFVHLPVMCWRHLIKISCDRIVLKNFYFQ